MTALIPLWADTLAAFDTETTGVHPGESRIVSATLALVAGDGSVRERYDWLINPGVPIPAAAAAVHGITTQVAQESGMQPQLAIAQIVEQIAAMLERGYPVTAYNAPFDLTLLRAEAARHGAQWPDEVSPVIDPLILDKQMDRFRKGKRQLGLVAEHYGVPLAQAHDAGADAIATAHIAQAIARKYGHLLPADAAELHAAQVRWAAEHAESLQRFFARSGRPHERVNGSWPLHS